MTDDPHDFEPQLRDLIDAERIIDAVKLCREKLGVDLSHGKAIVDALAKGETRPLRDALEAAEARGASAASRGVGDAALEEEVVELMRADRKIEAIKRYRERYKVDLATAKETVEMIAARHAIPPTKGCAAMLAVTALLLIGLGALVTA
ncbi:MAG: hypothetical protein GC159_05280 [Phycisphaera sp.]|nr:hypothetical protein [Phycisphaera sp.]